jgi:hypothetical protein
MRDTTRMPYAAYEVRQDIKPKDLQGLSEKLIDQHWKLYEGYVTNTNLLNKLIWDTAEAGKELNKAEYSEMQRRLGFEYNGMVLHEYYPGFYVESRDPTENSGLNQTGNSRPRNDPPLWVGGPCWRRRV